MISQAVGAFGLRRARYVGAGKTHLQHGRTATALHFEPRKSLTPIQRQRQTARRKFGECYPSNAGEQTLHDNLSDNHGIYATHYRRSTTCLTLPDLTVYCRTLLNGIEVLL